MTPQRDAYSDAKEVSRLDEPAVRQRCIRLHSRSDAQSRLILTVFVLVAAGLGLLQVGYHGYYYDYHRYHAAADPACIPVGQAALIIGAVLFPFIFGFRNYYLIDPVEHRLYSHFQFLWHRRRRLVFREGEVLSVTADTMRNDTRYTTSWSCRVIAIGKDWSRVPLSNWGRNNLAECNAQAAEIARQLNCDNHEAPPQSRTFVDNVGGKPAVRFEPSRRLVYLAPTQSFLWFIIPFIILMIFVLFFHRR